MRKWILVLATLIVGSAADISHAEEPFLEGVRSFTCDEKPFILMENDQGWRLAEIPELRVQETSNGWRLDDQGTGFIAYLKEQDSGTWIIENLAEDGYQKVDCIDITESLSSVATIMKLRTNESLEETQQQLNEARARIDSLTADFNKALALRATDYTRRTALEQQVNALSAENEELIVKLRSTQAELEELQNSLSKMKVRYSKLLSGETAD